MTPEEITASEDVGALYTQLQAAKAFGDDELARQIQRRMRDLSGQNTSFDATKGKSLAVDEVARARIRSDGEGGGSA